MKVKSESEAAQSGPTLSDLMDCSLPGSSVHGIFQVRVLEWGAIAFSGFIPRNGIDRASHVACDKESPATAGDARDQVRSLGQEDPLELERTTHSSILAWKISWTEEPGGLQSMGPQKVRHNE